MKYVILKTGILEKKSAATGKIESTPTSLESHRKAISGCFEWIMDDIFKRNEGLKKHLIEYNHCHKDGVFYK